MKSPRGVSEEKGAAAEERKEGIGLQRLGDIYILELPVPDHPRATRAEKDRRDLPDPKRIEGL